MNNVHFSSKSNEWATPQEFYDELNKEFTFDLDPCANTTNAKCDRYYTQADDGLSQSWDNANVFCNPPYGREIKHWIKKASEAEGGGSCDVDTSEDRHDLLSRLYLQQSRDKIYTWTFEIWRFKKFCTISKYGCYI